MAIKNHDLDNLIIESAKKEFLEKGFIKASLRTITKNVGITTGSIYTRYTDKDTLFESIIFKNLTKEKFDIFNINNLYNEVLKTKNVDKFLEVIKYEEKISLDFLYEYYDECVLLICKSSGSRIGDKIKSLLDQKAIGTVEFFKKISNNKINEDAIMLIITEQINYYKLLLEKGYSKEKAVKIMETVSLFINEGWKKIFEEIMGNTMINTGLKDTEKKDTVEDDKDEK